MRDVFLEPDGTEGVVVGFGDGVGDVVGDVVGVGEAVGNTGGVASWETITE